MSGDDRAPHDQSAPQAAEGAGESRKDLEEALSLEVTLRRQAEDQLKESEERLQLMIAGAEDHAFFVVGTDGRIVTWNRGATKLFGYSSDEAIGQPFAMIFTPEDREAGVPDRELQKAREDGAADDDRWHVNKEGTRFWAHGITTALSNDGSVRGFAKLIRDLTVQKQAEERLQESEARYRKQAEELAETNRQKDCFLAVLSHELRNPLAPIAMAAEVLGQQAKNPTTREAGEILQRQVEMMIRLVDDLLEASRITSGKVRLQKESLDLRRIARRAVDSTRSAVEAKKQQLLTSLPDEPVYLDADPVRIEQVIVNLLTNANKYTPTGGRLWLEVEQAHDAAIVRVRDNGDGIPPGTLPTLFTLFSQADRSLESSKGGLGIGLALVRSLVEMHGGTVEARSEGAQKGSEFVIRLPLSSEPPRETTPSSELPSNRRTLRILIVDDNDDAAKLLGVQFSTNGYQVRTERNGAAGLATAEIFRPHVVILDIAMPGMNGYELAARIRSNPKLRGVRLIAVTGHAQESHRKQSQEVGIDHHLVKPVKSAVLLKLLEELKPPPERL